MEKIKQEPITPKTSILTHIKEIPIPEEFKPSKTFNILLRTYNSRDLLKVLVLDKDNFTILNIKISTKEVTKSEKRKYRRPVHGIRNAQRVRVGDHTLDRHFRVNDYTIYENMFEITDAAYLREFYILHNRYGIAVANGRKTKLLTKYILSPIKQLECNFMDKEGQFLYLFQLGMPGVEPGGHHLGRDIELRMAIRLSLLEQNGN